MSSRVAMSSFRWTPSRSFSPILLSLFTLIFSGCAGPRVQVADDVVEESLQEITNIRSETVQAAKTKQQLGFWDVYALAVERTERLALRVEDLEQARAQTQQATGSYLPHLALNAKKGFWAPHAGSSGVSVQLHAEQPIWTGLQEVSAIRGARSLTRQRRLELRHDAQRLLLEVARSFYSVLQLQESLLNERSSRDLAQRMLDAQRSLRAQGRIRVSDVLSSEAQLARAEADLVAIQDQLEQAREQLRFLTGMEGDPTLAEEAPIFPDEMEGLDRLLPEAERRSDVLALREGVRVAKAQRLAAVGGFGPSLSAQGDYTLQRQGGKLGDAPRWSATLNASLPIFSGGQTAGRVREAKSVVRQAELQARQGLRSAQEEIRQAFAAYHNAKTQDAAYQKALLAAEKSHRAQEADYRMSLTNIVQYLQSLNELEQARLNAARSRYQWRLQRVALAVATGKWPEVGAQGTGETTP